MGKLRDLINSPIPWRNMDERTYARCLRLAVVQNQYDNGWLTTDDALELLRGPLTPGKKETICDDSAELVLKGGE